MKTNAIKKRSFNNPLDGLTDDIRNNRTFIIVTYAVLCLVALVMTIVNVLTDKGFLTWCTAVFSVLCALNIILTLAVPKFVRAVKLIFAVEVIAMFTFFLVTGNPDGFSAIWICMLPSIGMFFFDRYRGTAMCAVMFVILVFCLWTPIGNGLLMYDYTDTFKMRFPILFVAFHLLAFMLETLRVNAYKELRRLQDYYKEASKHDVLTGLFNRQGMYSELDSRSEYKSPKKLGAVIFDIDFFKKVNDTYGHDIGDEVLKEFSAIIKDSLDTVVCRWGGEEFVAIIPDGSISADMIDAIRVRVQDHSFVEGTNLHITVSAGVFESDGASVSDIDAIITKADKALYEAKNSGRNKIVHYEVSAAAAAD